MHEAAHLAAEYSSRGPCTTGRVSHPGARDPREPISTFERYRTLRALDPQRISLGIHLHLPDDCHLQDRQLRQAYVRALLNEAALTRRHLAGRPLLEQLYVYGNAGLFAQHDLQRLFSGLGDSLQLASNNFAWFNIEIHSGQADWSTLGVLRDAGFNRITLHASNDLQATQSLYEAARALQYCTITLVLPATLEERESLLQLALRLQPDRLVLENRLNGKGASRADSGRPEERLLTGAGYAQAGPGIFVFPDDELIEYPLPFQTGSQLREPVTLGLGAGAVSQLGALVYRNTQTLQDYIHALQDNDLPAALGHRDGLDEQVRRVLLLLLECRRSLDIPQLERHFGISFASHFAGELPQLEALARQGVIRLSATRLEVLQQGSRAVSRLARILGG